jgi:catechol 2,3-dioxygenase-like lactoylglutathione lyase family enzyme
MKFAHARIVTQDVPSLVRFYQELTGMTPVGDDRYTELHGAQLSLAISSQRMIELHSAGAARACATGSAHGSRALLTNLSSSRQRSLGATARCCSAIPTAI